MPLPRKRENRGLPARWRLKHGAVYYRVPPGQEHLWDAKQEFRLGADTVEAYGVWAERVKLHAGNVKTVGQLLDRYALQVVPAAKSPATRLGKERALPRLRAVFGSMLLTDFQPMHVYQYVDRRVDKHGRPALTAAHREIEVLSHAFTKAVEWGYLPRHPFYEQVRLDGDRALTARERYVEDWEIAEALALPCKRKKGSVLAVQAAIAIILLTPMRRADFLQLQPARDFKDDGIHVDTQKTGKPVIYDWTPELRDAVRLALEARPVDIAPWLFCTRKGACYYDAEVADAPGWDSMVQRFMARLLKETKVTASFTLHDVRAKTGSDAENYERARQLLAHAPGSRATATYRRKPEHVVPLTRKA